MSSSFTITKDRSDEALAAVIAQAQVAFEAIGHTMEGHAKGDCPVDTGRLRNSIGHAVETTGDNEVEVQVGTNVEYAPIQEFGDHLHHRVGKAHFLRDAAANHSSEYKKILEAALKE